MSFICRLVLMVMLCGLLACGDEKNVEVAQKWRVNGNSGPIDEDPVIKDNILEGCRKLPPIPEGSAHQLYIERWGVCRPDAYSVIMSQSYFGLALECDDYLPARIGVHDDKILWAKDIKTQALILDRETGQPLDQDTLQRCYLTIDQALSIYRDSFDLEGVKHEFDTQLGYLYFIGATDQIGDGTFDISFMDLQLLD